MMITQILLFLMALLLCILIREKLTICGTMTETIILGNIFAAASLFL
jgi:hypothetical protein